MLPKRSRLSSSDFRTLSGRGVAIHTPFGTLRAYRGEKPRFAVVVSKKVAKNAVLRHRTKRRIFEAIRAVHPPLSFPGVWYASSAATGASFKDLSGEVDRAIAQAAYALKRG